jgi:DNA processing protein
MKWLAVIGSRAVTPYGADACTYLIKGLSGHPIVIVSGLAFGVDALAHRAALDTGMRTVAVPGSGLGWDVLYPRAHSTLARDIVAHGGALMSEMETDARAAPYSFPQRNRIMAGMCHATLMIEAKEKSGSLITARLAADYNRELMVVPGSIFSDASRGTHQFLKLGAIPVTEPDDILRTLGLSIPERAPEQMSMRTDLSSDELRVLTLVASPLSRDELLRALNMPVNDAQVLLSIMEIKGLITETLGMMRAR